TQRGGGGRGDADAVADAPAARAAHKYQRAAGTHLADRVARDLKVQHDVIAEHLSYLGCVHLEQGRVVRARASDHYMVNRSGQVREEPLRGGRVRGVECRGALRAYLGRRLPEPSGIAAGEDDIRAFGPGAPGRLEADARAAADQHDGLPGQFPFAEGMT